VSSEDGKFKSVWVTEKGLAGEGWNTIEKLSFVDLVEVLVLEYLSSWAQ